MEKGIKYGKEWLEILKLISCLNEDTSTFIRPCGLMVIGTESSISGSYSIAFSLSWLIHTQTENNA